MAGKNTSISLEMVSKLDKQPFLNRLADKILKQKDDLLIVLPNKRSQYILAERLNELNVEEEWIVIRTVDQLMEEISGLELVEPEEALVAFYHAYKKVEKSPQTFEEFSTWATTFLADVNDVDLHLANIDDLYQQIGEYQSIDLDNSEPGPLEKGFRTFWERLPSYYSSLKKELKSINLGYRGLIYRSVAELTELGQDAIGSVVKDKTTYWVGVIPGNPSEQKLLRWIRENEQLEVFVDVDEYYLNRANHEAGRLFREDPNLSTALWKMNSIANDPKNLKVYPQTGLTSQVLMVNKIVDSIDEEDYHNTVIVLNDPKLLTPLMSILPRGKLNISYGHKLGKTSIHRFLMSWMNLHAQSIQLNGSSAFYHKQVADILKTPEVNKWLNGSDIWASIEFDVLKNNWKYISKDWLEERLGMDMFGEQAFHILFDWELNSSFIAERISKVLDEWISMKRTMNLMRIDEEALIVYQKKFKQLFAQFGDVLDSINLGSLRKFIHRHMSHASFHLAGENNTGIQVMSLFETRMVDFKHVIFLGASDDNLPGNPNQTTHIPFIHRKHFGLPTLHDSQSLTAYHFYRLLQRAENVHMIYNTSAQALSGGEPSRYLLQLKLELSEINKSFQIEEIEEEFSIDNMSQLALEVRKTPDVIEGIKSSLRLRLSPSAINKFINSPLEFYYYYVLGIKEQDSVEEDMEASTFGSVVHDVIEAIYKPFEGKMIDSDSLRSAIPTSEERVQARFLKDFSQDDISRGKNLIQVELAKDYVKSFIRQDLAEMAEFGVVRILALEDRLEEVVDLHGIRVRLFGYADRIDERNGIVRIIDYKTGKVELKDLKCDFSVMFSDSNYSKALQLAFYKWAYARRHQMPSNQIVSTIFSFRRQKLGYMPLEVSVDESSFTELFEQGLGDIVLQMLDETMPFMHYSDSKYTTF
jgi:ATP-dependent helicase/nuclease subunit B